MPITTGGTVNYNQKFIDTMEHFDTFLQLYSRKHPQIWADRIPKGNLSLFEGLTRKTNIFYGGLGEQAGLSNWSQINVSRKPSAGDPGFDACNYNPKTFDYAMEARQYTGYRCSWQSEPICVNDIRFLEEGKQQCIYICSFMSYITQSVWENWNRENYVKMAVDAGNAFILCQEGLDYTDSPTYRFTYDPYTENSDGDTYVTFPTSANISTLNWSFFDWWQDYLGDQCPEAAISTMDGLPVFGLMIHKRDFDRMVLDDSQLREDFRYYNAKVLIDNYNSYKEFKGWALIHDQRQMRFKIKSTDGTTTTATRVKPMKDGRSVTIGNIPVVDPNYNDAELALGVVFMNQIIQNLIPSPLANAGGGMIFGAQPSYNGEFRWINEYDRELNILREVGYFFARFEAFPKPLMYANEAIVFLYKRCPQTWKTDCDTCCDGTTGSGAISVATAAVEADVDATNNTVTLTLASCLPCELTEAVTLTDADSATATAYIADSDSAPTYVFMLAAAPSAYDKWDTTATVTCA